MKEKNVGKDIQPALKLLNILDSNVSLREPCFISDIHYDSRQVVPGSAFVCVPGEHVDGNQFIDDVMAKGASCIISQKPKSGYPVPYFQVTDVRIAAAYLADYFYDHPSSKLRLLGVTGTNGKTTTTHLVEHIINSSSNKCGLIGTLGTRIPGQNEYQNFKHTTPQASDLHKILASMVNVHCSHVAMEVSSHALVQERVAGCQFAVTCLTNITQDHLDFHQTMEHYWHAKRRLFESINLSTQTNKTAILNYDDVYLEEFLKVIGNSVHKITYGFDTQANIGVKHAEFTFAGTKLSLKTPWGVIDLKIKLTGHFNVYNVMAALGICLSEGIAIDDCVNALAKFTGVSGRFEVVSSDNDDNPLVIVDYAHTPDGLENVLKTARNLVSKGGRLISVFGCGGDRDVSKRPQMGQIAESLSDLVVITSDNPRTEDPQKIIADIMAGIKRTTNIKVEPDRASAIKLAVIQATSAQDVVVIAGKGHENYQILGNKTIDFDDRSQARHALQERYALLSKKQV